MIGHFMEDYIDDVVGKSNLDDSHLADLEKAFQRIQCHQLKMNPLKCAFGVSTGILPKFPDP